MSRSIISDGATGQHLCLECGLCCNGVIFADVQLNADEEALRLRSLGLRIRNARKTGGQARLQQPCAALGGCRCRIYDQRPQCCRDFECRLLQRVKDGLLESVAALQVIRPVRARVEQVRRLLRQLGDADETLPLRARFRRASKRLEAIGLDAPTAELFGQLTLAVHHLNLSLKESFYP